MPGINKRSYVLNQTYSYKLQVCLSMYITFFYNQILKGYLKMTLTVIFAALMTLVLPSTHLSPS